jgi:hypothetical protein
VFAVWLVYGGVQPKIVTFCGLVLYVPHIKIYSV